MPKVSPGLDYSIPPNPFVTPTQEVRESRAEGALGAFQLNPVKLIQHESLLYTGAVLEEIMYELNTEREFRGKSALNWRAYKRIDESGNYEFDEFVPGKTAKLATHLNGYPVKFFPQYVKDIQDVILDLVGESRYHDDIGSAMARIFLVNTTHTQSSEWGPKTALRTSYEVPKKGGQAELRAEDRQDLGAQGLETINALGNITSDFAFPASGVFVKSPTPRVGVDILGNEYVVGAGSTDTSIVVSDPDWPRPSVGIVRTEQDWFHSKQENAEGEEREGVATSAIDGAFIPMREEGRPVQDRSIRPGAALNSAAAGTADPDSGYGIYAHHPLIVQQLRFQPPTIEHFGTETTAKRDYVEAVFSAQTPNLPWYHSQPVEKQFFGDWGTWLMQGEVQMTGDSAYLRAYADPQYNVIPTNCPYNVFRPEPSSTCSCFARNTAYAIWNSNEQAIVWSEHTWTNFFTNSGRPKQFGPKTRLRISGSFTTYPGAGGDAYVTIAIRTNRIADVNLQPFVNIITLGNGGEATNSVTPGSQDVNIMDAMQYHYSGYEKSGVDFILAMAIFASNSSSLQAVVLAEDGPGGSFIPETDLGCALGETVADVDYIQLYEPPWDGQDDRNPSKGSGT